MTRPENYIAFTLSHSETACSIRTYWHEYPNLRALIRVKFKLEDFGQCGGLGRCGTCMVKISPFSAVSRTNTPGYSGLACQILISDDLSNTCITLLMLK